MKMSKAMAALVIDKRRLARDMDSASLKHSWGHVFKEAESISLAKRLLSMSKAAMALDIFIEVQFTRETRFTQISNSSKIC
jgi:hypothetical protein